MSPVKGVLISCDGDMSVKNIPRFSPFEFKQTDEIYSMVQMLHQNRVPIGLDSQFGTCDIPEVIGIDLMVRRHE